MHKSIVTKCYRIACSVKQIQEVKTQEFQKLVKLVKEGQCFYHSVQVTIVKSQNLSKSKKQVGYWTKMSVSGDAFLGKK